MVEKEHIDLEAIGYLSRILDLRTRRGISIKNDGVQQASGADIQKIIKLLKECPSEVKVRRSEEGTILGFEILEQKKS